MERLRKIRQIIYDWRQSFKTEQKGKKYVTSRQANRKFINLLKGRRDVNRWRQKKLRRTQRFQDLHSVSVNPSAPPMIVPSAPPMRLFSDPDMPH
jgi:tRNA/tmRNA/rRNA uracil-C5-methylase (TrmA/RlmC/RlmD family)